MAVSLIVKGPKFRTAQQLVADGTFPVTQATLLKTAKKHSVGKKLGRAVVFSDADIETLYEALPCHSNLSGDQNHRTGSYVARSAASQLKKLQARLTKK